MKSKVIGRMIIILLIIILILGGISCYLYFTTDLFKSNQQLFFKYLGQTLDMQNGFMDTAYVSYLDKKETGKYENSGSFSVNMNIEGIEDTVLETINNFNIEYSGLVDNTASKSEQNITLNYSEDVNFPIKYKYANNIGGLQTDYISSKYIGVDTTGIQEFMENMGSQDPERVDEMINSLGDSNINEIFNFTEEEREQLQDTYLSLLQEKLKDIEFTKTEENGTTTYSVEITNQQLQELVVTVLETVKNDSLLMPKIEQLTSDYFEIINNSSDEDVDVTAQSLLQDYIDSINESGVIEGTTSLSVSQTDGIVNGIMLKTGENDFTITKSNNQGTVAYRFEINATDTDTGENIQYFLTANYEGLDQLTTVNETYQLGMITTVGGEEEQIVYNINSTNNFRDDINIADYTEDEVQILNDYDSEQITTLLASIIERIIEVNDMQMEQIGFSEYGNPILYTFPFVSLNTLITNQAADVVNQ